MKSYTKYTLLMLFAAGNVSLIGAATPVQEEAQPAQPVLWLVNQLSADLGPMGVRLKAVVLGPEDAMTAIVIKPEQTLALGSIESLQGKSIRFVPYGDWKGFAIDKPIIIAADEFAQIVSEKCSSDKPDLTITIQWDRESKTSSSSYTGYMIKKSCVGTPLKHFKEIHTMHDQPKCLLSYFFGVKAKHLDDPKILAAIFRPGARSDDKLFQPSGIQEAVGNAWAHLGELDVLKATRIDLYRYVFNLPKDYHKPSLEQAYRALLLEWAPEAVAVDEGERAQVVAFLEKAYNALGWWLEGTVVQEPRRGTDATILLRLGGTE